jgi:thiamine pyrophosphokinase
MLFICISFSKYSSLLIEPNERMKTLILCNGEPPPQNLFEEALKWADLFIAADGGGNTARSLDAAPDFVIGDLDSYRAKEDEEIELIHDTDQETNDLEKTLSFVKKRGGAHVKVLAATGLRLDQTLKNLSVLKQFNDQFQQLVFVDKHGTIQLLPHAYSKAIPVGTTVSLFPLSGKVTGVTTEGLKYSLNDEDLENGVRDGSSNRVAANLVSITYQKGDLLLITGK